MMDIFKKIFYQAIPTMLVILGCIGGAFSVLVHLAATTEGSVPALISLCLTLVVWIIGLWIRHKYYKRPSALVIPHLVIVEECIYILLSFALMLWPSGQFVPQTKEVLLFMITTTENGMQEYAGGVGEILIGLLAATMGSYLLTAVIMRCFKQRLKGKGKTIWQASIMASLMAIVAYKTYVYEYAWRRPQNEFVGELSKLIAYFLFIFPIPFYLGAVFRGHPIIEALAGNPSGSD